jgi:hypothetical protein
MIAEWDTAGRPAGDRWTCGFTAPNPTLRPLGWNLATG